MSLFSLDVLDPSLVKRPSQSPRIPLQTLSSTSTDVPSTPSKQQRKTEEAGPPRWNTPEFWFYGVVFVIVVPMMFYCAYDVSKGMI
jgi:protein-cysteine N-palmitoyltransferase HHAT